MPTLLLGVILQKAEPVASLQTRTMCPAVSQNQQPLRESTLEFPFPTPSHSWLALWHPRRSKLQQEVLGELEAWAASLPPISQSLRKVLETAWTGVGEGAPALKSPASPASLFAALR